MARTKREASKNTKKESKSSLKAVKDTSDHDLKSHIRALGGDVAEDYELLKNADSDGLEDVENIPNDITLLTDVSKFMKSLEFGSAQAQSNVNVPGGEQSGEKTKGGKKLEKSKQPSNDKHVDEKPDAKIAEVTAKLIQSSKSNKTKFIVSPTPQWYLAVPALPPVNSIPAPSPEFLASKKEQAAKVLEQDAEAYASSSAHTSSIADARFLSRVLASGTLSDRLSALTLMAQGSPLHNTRALDSLKSMASKKGRQESLKALRAIVDWWVGGGAPDRKLKYFLDQPLTHPNVTDQHLAFWYFEDWLKKYFFTILQLLEGLSVDPLPYVRTQAAHLIFQLLRDKPEQEQNLLRLLVNKLNDSDKSIASKTSHHLLQLLQLHPDMKKIIVQEVSGFILRPVATSSAILSSSTSASQTPKNNAHARYYAVITFNQILLKPKDKDVAERLIDIYFKLFKELLGENGTEEKLQHDEERDFTPKQRKGTKGKKKDFQKDHKGKGKAPDSVFQEVPDATSKLVSAILTGINRALPFAKAENSATFKMHYDTLFRITHTATFNVSLQALVLMHQVCKSSPSVSARFYRALYASLVDPRLAHSAKQAMYLNLLFKAVKEDGDHARVAAFVKRFLQVLSMHRPEFICGGLYLLGELFNVSPDIRKMTSESQMETEPYDPRKREPQYAHAESTCLWELLTFLNHYHPSVALHARQLLAHTQVTATADLGLNTLSHFLDRFIYRNPKMPKPKGASAMQPAAHDDQPGTVHAGKGANATDVIVPAQLQKKKEAEVPADQLFFHKFFLKKQEKEKARASKADKRKRMNKGDEAETTERVAEGGSDSDPEEAEEAEIWAAMKQSIPELGGSDIDDDSDIENDEDIGTTGKISEYGDDDTETAGVMNKLQNDSDDSALDMLEDDDDLIGSDDENPTGLIEYSSEKSKESDGEWPGVDSTQKAHKRVREDDGKRKKKRQKLATFASYEDYAEMIEDGKEDDI